MTRSISIRLPVALVILLMAHSSHRCRAFQIFHPKMIPSSLRPQRQRLTVARQGPRKRPTTRTNRDSTGITNDYHQSNHYMVLRNVDKENDHDDANSSNSSSNRVTNQDHGSRRAEKSWIELELEDLQVRYSWIEALEARNQAQLESFVNEQEQWESLEPEEQQLLASKEQIESRMEVLAEQLIQLWMGQKTMEG